MLHSTPSRGFRVSSSTTRAREFFSTRERKKQIGVNDGKSGGAGPAFVPRTDDDDAVPACTRSPSCYEFSA